MKFHEAIDMILDGGRAYRKADNDYRVSFSKIVDDWLIVGEDDEECTTSAILTKEDFTATDWIVEKDVVVYEEPHLPIICVKSRTHEKDEPAELENSGKKWEEIKLPIIADEVNEEWLEKKMLCFMKRVILSAGNAVDEGTSLEDILPVNQERLECHDCGHDDCHFCQKDTQKEEPRESAPEKCRKCGMSMYQCNEVRPSHTPKAVYRCPACDDGQPTDKVTVEDVLYLINGVVGAEIADTMALFCPNYDEETRSKMRKGSSEALEFWGGELKQKLAYLVSLQEK